MNTVNMAHRFSLLVLLYNKEVKDCLTLQTLIKYPDLLKESHLCIWNNGPTKIEIPEEIRTAVCELSLIQTLNNESLSKIYNFFFDNFDSEYYILLDDDSLITANYIRDVLQLTNEKFVTPIIKSNGKIVSPSNKMNNSKEEGYSLRAIASGLILRKELIDELKDRYGKVADENFYFYGVDTTLVYRINKLKLSNQLISGFEHKVSEHEKESLDREEFKIRELSYSFGLKLRHYPNIGIYKILVRVLINCILNKKNKLRVRDILKSFLLKSHPKNLMSHHENSICNCTNLQKKQNPRNDN